MACFRVLLLITALAVLTKAQPKLSDIPEGCKITSSNPNGCLYAKPIPYFGACEVYNDGRCWKFCQKLVHRPGKCVTNKPDRYQTTSLRLSCVKYCLEAKKSISLYVDKGKDKSLMNALIYVGLDQEGEVTAKNYVYEFSSTPIRHTTCPPQDENGPKMACFSPNDCVCSKCWSDSAQCPECCSWAGHIYL